MKNIPLNQYPVPDTRYHLNIEFDSIEVLLHGTTALRGSFNMEQISASSEPTANKTWSKAKCVSKLLSPRMEISYRWLALSKSVVRHLALVYYLYGPRSEDEPD